MNSLVKNIPIATVSLRGLLPFLLLVGCIIALFFVPDVLKVTPQGDRTRQRGDDVVPLESQSEADIATPQVTAPRYSSPLDEILQSIESKPAVLTAAQEQQAWLGVSGEKAPTWESLRNEAGQAAIKNAQAEARNLLPNLNERFVEARSALLSAIALFDFILSDSAQIVSAEEAVRQLEVADLEVAAALQNPEIDRSLYLRWMEVSLAPAIEGNRTARLKHQLLHPFDPHLRLQEVRAAKIEPGPGSYEPVQSDLHVTGVVRGDDVQEMQLFHNGYLVSKVPIGGTDEDGYRRFSFSQPRAFGAWTIRVRDIKGNLYEKSYRFFPRVERFPREGYSYILPFSTTVPDPRLDRLFRVSERKGPTQGDVSSVGVQF